MPKAKSPTYIARARAMDLEWVWCGRAKGGWRPVGDGTPLRMPVWRARRFVRPNLVLVRSSFGPDIYAQRVWIER